MGIIRGVGCVFVSGSSRQSWLGERGQLPSRPDVIAGRDPQRGCSVATGASKISIVDPGA